MGLFGLVKKAAIYNAVEKAYKDNLYIYDQEIYKLIKVIDTLSDEEQEQYAQRALSTYCLAAGDAAIQAVSNAEGQASLFSFKLMAAMGYPAKFGYDDYDYSTTPWAGAIYALLIYVACDTTAPQDKCVQLNHYQNDLMNQILGKYSSQM